MSAPPQLAEVERSQRAADQIGASVGNSCVVGQECIGDKICRVDAAEDEAELPGSAACSSPATSGGLAAR